MKYLLLCFTALSFQLSAQINGTYVLGNETYNFYTNGTFSHDISYGENETMFGHGHYGLRRDTLLLTFEISPAERSFSPEIITTDCTGDSTVIDVQVYAADNLRPVSFASVSLYSSFVEKHCDVNGHCTLRVPKSHTTDMLLVHQDIYAFKSIEIDHDKSYNIKVYLSQDATSYTPEGKDGEVKKYLIRRQGKRLIKLKPPGTTGKFRVYKKKEEEDED